MALDNYGESMSNGALIKNIYNDFINENEINTPEAAFASLFTNANGRDGILGTLGRIVDVAEGKIKDISALDAREQKVYNQIAKSGKETIKKLGVLRRTVEETAKNEKLRTSDVNNLLTDVADEIGLITKESSPTVIGNAVMNSIQGSGLGKTLQAYKNYLKDLQRRGLVNDKDFYVFTDLVEIERLLNSGVLKRSEIDAQKGIADINNRIAAIVEKSQGVMNPSRTIKKGLANKKTVAEIVTKNAPKINQGSFKDWMAQQNKEVQDALKGVHAQVLAQADKGLATLLKGVTSGEKTMASGLEKIVKDLNQRGYAVGYQYNKRKNAIELIPYIPGDPNGRNNKPITFYIPKDAVLGTGGGRKVNALSGYQRDDGGFGLYTKAEEMVEVTRRVIARQNIESIEDIHRAARIGYNATFGAAAGASGRLGAKPDFAEQKASNNPTKNRWNQFVVGFANYAKQVMYQKGSNLLHNGVSESEAERLITEAFTNIVSSATSGDARKVISKMEHDPAFAPLTKSSVWKSVKNTFLDVRNSGFQISAGVANETSLQNARVGAAVARNIIPGGVDTASNRNQGLGTLGFPVFQMKNSRVSGAQFQSKYKKHFRRNKLASKVGELIGVKYGEQGGWDALTNIVYITDDILAEAQKNLGRTTPAPSVREGMMLLNKEMAQILGESSRVYSTKITGDEFRDLRDKEIGKVIEKFKRQYGKPEYWDISQESDIEVRKEFERMVGEAVYGRLLKNRGRLAAGFEEFEYDPDEDSYILSGYENKKFSAGTRVVGSTAKTRSAANVADDELWGEIMRILKSRGLISEDMAKKVSAISATTPNPDVRNYGALFNRGLGFITSNYGGTAAEFIEELKKTKDGAVLAEMLEASGKNKDQIYVHNVMDKIREKYATEEERNAAFVSMLRGIDEFSRQHFGVSTGNFVTDAKGNRIAPAIQIGSENLGLADTYEYGHFGESVSMSSAIESVENSVGAAIASNKITREEGEKAIEWAKQRLQGDQKRIELGDRAKAAWEAANLLTLHSTDAKLDPNRYADDDARVVSIGYGSDGKNYTIDLDTVEEAIYEGGKVANYDKTLMGRIAAEIEAKKLAGIDEKDIQTFIDGVNMAGSITYDGKNYHEILANRLYLPTLLGTKDYSRFGDAMNGILQGLIPALMSGDAEAIQKRGMEAYSKLGGSITHKSGAIWQYAYKQRIKDTAMPTLQGVNMANILDDAAWATATEAEKQLSRISESGLMLSPETAYEVIRGLSKEALDALGREIYGNEWKSSDKRPSPSKYAKIAKGLTIGSDEYNKYIAGKGGNAIGLNGFAGRLPFITGLDTSYLKSIFIDPTLQGRGSASNPVARIGAGLAYKMNADYDSDKVAVAFDTDVLDPEIAKILSAIGVDQSEVTRKLALKAKEKEMKSPKYDAADVLFSEMAEKYSGTISRSNKPLTGVLSNFSKSIRLQLREAGFDESALVREGNSEEAQRKAAAGMLVRGLFEHMEQDVISSKKVVNRMIKAKAAALGVNTNGMSAQDLDDLYEAGYGDVKQIVDSFLAGNVKSSELFSKLQTMGVLGTDDEFIDGRYIDTILRTVEQFSHGKDILKGWFGVTDNAELERKIQAGTISREALVGALGLVAGGRGGEEEIDAFLGKARNKKGFMEEYRDPTTSPESAAYIYGLKNHYNAVNTTAEAYELLAKARDKSADSLERDIKLESQKIGIANAEARAIGNASNKWKGLAYSLNNAIDGYESVSDAASRMLQKPAYQPSEEQQRVNAVMARLMGNKDFDVKAWEAKKDKEIATAFGFKTVKDFKAYRDSSDFIALERGSAAHAIREAMHEFNRDRGTANAPFVSSFRELLEMESEWGNNPAVVRAVAEAKEKIKAINKKLSIFRKPNKGYFIKDTISRGELADQALRSLMGFDDYRNAYNELVIDTFDLDPNTKRLNADSGRLTGRIDLGRLSMEGVNRNVPVWKITDIKNQDYGPANHDIVQMLKYIEMNRKIQAQIKEIGEDEFVSQYNALNPNKPIDVNYVNDLKKAWGGVQGEFLIVNSKGEGYRYSVNNIPEDLREKINNNEKVTKADLEGVIGSGVRMTEAETKVHLEARRRAGIRTSEESYQEKKVAQETATVRKKNEKEEASAVKELNALYREQLKIRKDIYDLEHRRNLSTNVREKDAIDKPLRRQIGREAELRAQIQALEGSGRISDANLNKMRAEFDFQDQLNKERIDTKDHGARNIWDLMAADIKRSFTRVFDYGVALRVIQQIQMKIRELIQTVISLDTAMTNLRIVTGYGEDQAKSLMKTYNGLAQQLGVTTQAVAESANEWLRQGYSVESTNSLIEASVHLAKLGMTTAENATEQLTSTLKGFKMEAEDAMSVVDKFVSLDMEFATSASDIGEALSRTAAVAQQAGLDLDQAAAAITTIIDVTQAAPESVGNAFKTILSRYGNVKAGAFESLMEGDETSENINDVERVLRSLGISIRNSSMEMRDFSDVLDELAEKWASFSSVEKNAIATAMAGTRQRNAFMTLMDNYQSYQEALEISQDSDGTAEQKYGAYMDSVAASIEKLKAAWEGFAQAMDANPIFKFLVDAATQLVNLLPKVFKHVTSLFVAMNAYKVPKILSSFTFSPFKSSALRSGGLGFGGLFGVAGQTKANSAQRVSFASSLGMKAASALAQGMSMSTGASGASSLTPWTASPYMGDVKTPKSGDSVKYMGFDYSLDKRGRWYTK